MLVLSRKKLEGIVIGDNIVITVMDIRGDKVRLGITAPRDTAVHRDDIVALIRQQQADDADRITECG